jgi:hypothetical protein
MKKLYIFNHNEYELLKLDCETILSECEKKDNFDINLIFAMAKKIYNKLLEDNLYKNAEKWR